MLRSFRERHFKDIMNALSVEVYFEYLLPVTLPVACFASDREISKEIHADADLPRPAAAGALAFAVHKGEMVSFEA
jgi:hypothetical protein